MDLFSIAAAIAFLAAFIGVYAGSVAWSIGDAQKRGYSGGGILLLFCLLGPLSALVWLCVRPRATLAERSHDAYMNADDALAAASRLDMLGDWDAAIALYENAARRWPEHGAYVENCINRIGEKRALASD